MKKTFLCVKTQKSLFFKIRGGKYPPWPPQMTSLVLRVKRRELVFEFFWKVDNFVVNNSINFRANLTTGFLINSF